MIYAYHTLNTTYHFMYKSQKYIYKFLKLIEFPSKLIEEIDLIFLKQQAFFIFLK
jgi:hypothetical protein